MRGGYGKSAEQSLFRLTVFYASNTAKSCHLQGLDCFCSQIKYLACRLINDNRERPERDIEGRVIFDGSIFYESRLDC